MIQKIFHIANKLVQIKQINEQKNSNYEIVVRMN